MPKAVQPSGKFVIRIEPELHRRLQKEALESNHSLNEICRKKLASKSIASELPFGLSSLHAQWGDSLLGLVLFGSVASGTETVSSDVDVLCVIDSSIPLTRSLYREVKDSLPPRVSLQIIHLPAQTPGSLWLEVALEGIVLWETDFRVSRALGKVRSLIADGAVKRKFTHGHPYWVWPIGPEKMTAGSRK